MRFCLQPGFLMRIFEAEMVESMVEVYYNSGQFRKTLSWIETFYQEMFSFYESLGAYYEEKDMKRSLIPGSGVMRFSWNF